MLKEADSSCILYDVFVFTSLGLTLFAHLNL